MNHTPTGLQPFPWKVSEHKKWKMITDANGITVISPASGDEKTLNFIVTACNAHEDLLKAIKDLIELVQSCEYDGEPIREGNYSSAIKALAKAGVTL